MYIYIPRLSQWVCKLYIYCVCTIMYLCMCIIWYAYMFRLFPVEACAHAIWEKNIQHVRRLHHKGGWILQILTLQYLIHYVFGTHGVLGDNRISETNWNKGLPDWIQRTMRDVKWSSVKQISLRTYPLPAPWHGQLMSACNAEPIYWFCRSKSVRIYHLNLNYHLIIISSTIICVERKKAQ